MNGIRRLCGTVLIMEAVILGLAILPAIVLEHANRPLAGGVGGGLAVCALLLSGMVGRPHMGWALKAGSVLQVLFIAAGVVLSAMYVLGVIFTALWITGIWLARRWETPVASHADLSAVSVAITTQTADKPPASSRTPGTPAAPGPAA
jgi:Protein of unknown function (DUF4233)